MSIKVKASLPAGQHYAQYSVEVPLEAIGINTSSGAPAQAQQHIVNFTCRTIAAIHGDRASQDYDGQKIQSSLPRTSPQSGNEIDWPGIPKFAREDDESLMITLIDDSGWGNGITYSGKRNHRLHTALEQYAKRTNEDLSKLSLYYPTLDVKVTETDTARSLGIANSARFRVYRERKNPRQFEDWEPAKLHAGRNMRTWGEALHDPEARDRQTDLYGWQSQQLSGRTTSWNAPVDQDRERPKHQTGWPSGPAADDWSSGGLVQDGRQNHGGWRRPITPSW